MIISYLKYFSVNACINHDQVLRLYTIQKTTFYGEKIRRNTNSKNKVSESNRQQILIRFSAENRQIPINMKLNCIITLALTLTLHQSLSAQSTSTPFTSITTTTTVKVSSFESFVSNNKVLLNWNIEGNQDAYQFEVEKSVNGKDFVMAALVFGTDKADKDAYQFYEKKTNENISYRIKVISKNGTATYSQVITAGTNTNK